MFNCELSLARTTLRWAVPLQKVSMYQEGIHGTPVPCMPCVEPSLEPSAFVFSITIPTTMEFFKSIRIDSMFYCSVLRLYKMCNRLTLPTEVPGGDLCLLGDSFTEVKARRLRPVLGWVTTRGKPYALNLCPSVGVDHNL